MDQEELLEALGMDEPEDEVMTDWQLEEERDAQLREMEMYTSDIDEDKAEMEFQRRLNIEGTIEYYQYHIKMLQLQLDGYFNVHYALENSLESFNLQDEAFTEAGILAMIAFSTSKYAEIPAPPSVQNAPQDVFDDYDPDFFALEDENHFYEYEDKYDFADTHLEYDGKYYVVPSQLPLDYITAWENAGSPTFEELAARNS